ncbi:MAG TPA: hypothetical protein VFS30_01635 [Dehalococcoidia bacterium]|nr:hypothetical protein [Dehalococcoidia bacterium]
MRTLKGLLPLLCGAVVAAVLIGATQPPERAEAHPLGNFSVNRLVIVDLDGQGLITLRYVVDMAEIPTFQKLNEIDINGDGFVSATEETAYLGAAAEELIDGLVLEIDGLRLALTAEATEMELLEGQGGLQTLRTVIDARGALPDGWQAGVAATLRDENYGGEPGWRQVVVRPGAEVGLTGGDAVTVDVTAELTAYPENLLKSPPRTSEANFAFSAGSMTAAPAAISQEAPTVSRDAAGKTLGRFASIVSRENVTPGLVLLGLLLAAGWGAMHALGPGHGKTVVAAYLVGEHGRPRHAVYLGLIVTATHTLSVFVLGAIAIFAANVLSADDVYYWLSLASGVLVALLGGCLLVTRLRRLRARRHEAVAQQPDDHEHDHHSHGNHGHDHAHDILHGDDHGHAHVPPAPGWRGLVALGVSGGLVPCPTALVVMLGAIAIDRTIYGMVLVTAFSVGLAGVLTAIGLLMVYGQHMLAGSRARSLLDTKLARGMMTVSPVLSAVAILGLGLVLASRATL